jgi:paraquat-inducible protein B
LIAQAQALRIGVFAVGALLLLVAAVAAVFGARLLADSERVVMHFNGSVRGLDLGAPVVLRGVRVGSVRAIRLERGATGLEVPVEAELALPPLGPGGLKGLLAQGLSAQLATQSLLTGQLYVELDLRPLPGRLPATPAASGLTTIPTVAQRFESLQAQLETLDLSRIAQDLAAVLASARTLATSPETKAALADLARASASLSRLSATLDQRSAPLATRADAALARVAQAAEQLGTAAGGIAGSVDGAAGQVGAAAGSAQALLTPGSPLLASLQKAADELARSAAVLATTAAPDGAAAQRLERTAMEVARAARSLRELSTLLQEQPEALLRGRRNDTGGPP